MDKDRMIPVRKLFPVPIICQISDSEMDLIFLHALLHTLNVVIYQISYKIFCLLRIRMLDIILAYSMLFSRLWNGFLPI